MHVAIDRENMGFLWAHPSYQALLELAHIEVETHVHVVSLENPRYFKPFADFTDLELRLLYENTTGEKFTGLGRKLLEQLVCGLAMRLPQVDVSLTELSVQAEAVTDEYAGLYRYVKGSRVPKLVEDGLFGVPPKRVARCPVQEQQATAGTLLPVLPEPGPLCAGAGRDRTVTSTSTPARTRAPGTTPPPRGSTRETIWACADRMWEEAGKPTQPSAVLALRKQMMNQLEADGVKRTSSSNELGNWQKARIV